MRACVRVTFSAGLTSGIKFLGMRVILNCVAVAAKCVLMQRRHTTLKQALQTGRRIIRLYATAKLILQLVSRAPEISSGDR